MFTPAAVVDFSAVYDEEAKKLYLLLSTKMVDSVASIVVLIRKSWIGLACCPYSYSIKHDNELLFCVEV